MKKLSQLISEAKQKLDFQEDTINYIPANDLKTYLKVADKFIVQWPDMVKFYDKAEYWGWIF